MAINKYGGGAKTNLNGLKFEQETSLNSALLAEGYAVKGNTVYNGLIIKGYSVPKYELYKHFKHLRDGQWKNYISKQLLPDEAFYNVSNNTIYIIEKKFQEKSGSVDEKIQTCGFKLLEYKRMFDPVGIDVVYIYILSDWFNDQKYDDVKQYILDNDCYFYFNEIPLDDLGL